MTIVVVQPIFDAIDAAMTGSLVNGTTSLMQVASVVFGSLWMMHYTLKSIGWLFHGLDMIFKDVIYSMLRMAFVCSCAFNLGWYMEVVVPFVTNAPVGITQILTGTNSATTNMLDILINSYIETVINLVNAMDFNIWNGKNFLNAIVTIAILLVSGIAFLGVCASTLIMLKVSTSVFMVIGPVFIAFFLFDSTKQYAWGWINLIAGFMLTNILCGVVMSMEINYINTTMLSGENLIKANWVSLLSMPIVFAAFAAVLQVVPNYAASVMSGTPVSNGGGIGGMLKTGGFGAATKMASGIGSRFGPKKNKIS